MPHIHKMLTKALSLKLRFGDVFPLSLLKPSDSSWEGLLNLGACSGPKELTAFTDETKLAFRIDKGTNMK